MGGHLVHVKQQQRRRRVTRSWLQVLPDGTRSVLQWHLRHKFIRGTTMTPLLEAALLASSAAPLSKGLPPRHQVES
jgi:hypothetical protein